MAFDFPLLENYITRPELAPRKAAAPSPKRKFDTLPEEEQAAITRQAQLDLAQEELARKPRSALGEIGTAIQRGAMVELPRLAGQALKSTGGPGDALYGVGKNLVDNAAGREPKYARDTLSGTHNAVTEAFVSGGEMLAPSVAPLAALPVLAAAGVPAAAGAVAAGVAGGALFGSAQYQDTYEKAVKEGKTPEQAHQLGLQTGAIEGAGEALGGAVLGRLISTGRALPRILGKKYPVDEALTSIRDPKFLKQFATEMGKTAVVETATEMGQGAGEAAVEHNAGIDETTPWQAATHSIGPTLALTGLLGPLAAFGVRAQQKRNQKLLGVVEAGTNTDAQGNDVTFDATNRAVRELAPQIEPLVGKEAAMQWRMDVLVRANQLEAGKRQMGQDQNDAMVADAESSLQPRQEPIGAIPGIVKTAPVYADQAAAQAAWDNARPEFALKPVTEPAGPEVPVAAEPIGITPAEAAQPQLDLAHVNPGDSTVLTPTTVNEPAPGPTIMQSALLGAQKSLDYDKAAQQRAEGDAARRAADEERLAGLATTTRRVEAANKFADDAIAGKINGNTPVAFEDLSKVWGTAAAESGMDVSVLKGQHLARVRSILRKSAQQKLWVNQLGSLRKARDAMGEGTVSRDSLDALITKLENYNGNATAVREEKGQGNGQAPAVPEGQEAGGQGSSPAGQAAVPAQEVTPPTPAPTVEATPASPPAPAKTAGAGTQTKEVVVSATGTTKASAVGTPVPWGDFSRNVDGTVSYESKPSGVTTPEAPKFAKATRTPTVPVVSQRRANDDSRYAFELYHYDPKLGPASGTNNIWLQDYAQAQKDALGLSDKGKRTQASMKAALNARTALSWLHDYEGQFDWNAWEKAQMREAILATNTRMRETAKEYQQAIEDRVAYEYKQKLLAKKLGREPSKWQVEALALTPAQEKEVTRIARDDPGMVYLQAVAPKFEQIAGLTEAVTAGDLASALTSIKAQGTPWMQRMVDTLTPLVGKTKIQFVDEFGRNDKGGRVYGRYNHTSNTVTIYLGGDNPQTVIHELAHAATVAMLRMAKTAMGLPESQRTSEMHAAVASLGELREFMAEIKQRDPSGKFSYAQKNEEEFVAEVFSNEEFQTWLRGRGEGLSFMARFIDWLRSLVGMSPIEGKEAWTQALSISESFLSDSRFTDTQGLSFDHSATGAMGQANAVGASVVKLWEQGAAKSSFLGTLGGKFRSGFLHAATTFHISQWIDKVPALRNLVDGMHKYTDTDALKRVILQVKQLEFDTVVKRINFALAKLPLAQRDPMNAKLMGFAGDMSTLSIDLNKNFDQNLAANKSLDPTLKDYVNRRHAEYMRLPAEFKKPLETSFRVFRKNYIQHTALVLRMALSDYAKDPRVAALMSTIDIMDPSLKEGGNPKPEFFHDPYSRNLDVRIQKTIEEINKFGLGKEDPLRTDVAEIATFYNAALANPYMHLGRSGEHFLEFNVANTPGAWEAVQALAPKYGKVIGGPTERRHVFMRFENPAQRNEMMAKVQALGDAIEGGTRQGSLDELDQTMNMQGVPRAFHRLISKVKKDFDGPEKAELRNYLTRALIDMLPDSSAQKALVQRKDGGVPGYDADFVRNFSKRATAMASMVSNQYTLPLYDAAFDSMKKEVNDMRTGDPNAQTQANEVLAEMGKRFANSISPVDSPIIDKVKAFGFNYFLAFSPAFWLTNMVQPWHLTLPYIGGRYGFVATAKEMGKSTAKAGKLIAAAAKAGWGEGMDAGGVRGALMGVLDLSLPIEQTGLSPAEVAFVRRLVESGQLDTTQGHELGRYADGDSPGTTTTLKVLSVGSHYTEVLNRLTAGLTAFNMAQSKGGHGAELAAQYGVEAVRATQFDYSDQNTGRAFGRHGVVGKVTPLLASFQNYTFQTTELLLRLAVDSIKGANTEEKNAARWGLAGVLTVTSMLAGTLGLPLVTAIAAVVDAVLGDDDDPMDVKAAYRLWLADVLGKDVAEAVARGIPRAALGFDTSGRTGLQDLLPGSRFMADRRAMKDRLEGGALNLLGPAVSAGASVATGIGHITDGQVMDGLIEFLPLALKGPVKAVKMDTEGYTTATGNRLPIEVTMWGEVAQAFGFTPSVKAEQSEANFALRQRDGLLTQRKTLLANKLYRAVESGEDSTAQMEEVMVFNSTNPQYKIDVSAGLKARAKARSTAALSEAGIATLPRYLPQLDRYNYANVR